MLVREGASRLAHGISVLVHPIFQFGKECWFPNNIYIASTSTDLRGPGSKVFWQGAPGRWPKHILIWWYFMIRILGWYYVQSYVQIVWWFILLGLWESMTTHDLCFGWEYNGKPHPNPWRMCAWYFARCSERLPKGTPLANCQNTTAVLLAKGFSWIIRWKLHSAILVTARHSSSNSKKLFVLPRSLKN